MSVLLAIETSSDIYRVVLGREGEAIFDSETCSGSRPSRDLAALVALGLASARAHVSDVRAIILNIGPGGLSYVRSGVSFANALAFSIGIAIFPFTSFQIVAEQSQKLTSLPVIYAIPAASDEAYVALLRGRYVKMMRFGSLAPLIQEVSAGLTEIAVVGRIRDRVSSLLPGLRVVDHGLEKPDAAVLLQMGCNAVEQNGASVKQASPLNEQAAIFYE